MVSAGNLLSNSNKFVNAKTIWSRCNMQSASCLQWVFWSCGNQVPVFVDLFCFLPHINTLLRSLGDILRFLLRTALPYLLQVRCCVSTKGWRLIIQHLSSFTHFGQGSVIYGLIIGGKTGGVITTYRDLISRRGVMCGLGGCVNPEAVL